MPGGGVPDLVREDGRQLIIALREFHQRLVHEDAAAGNRERVDLLALDDLKVVGELPPAAVRGQPLAQRLHALAHVLVFDGFVSLQHLLGDAVAHVNLALGGGET